MNRLFKVNGIYITCGVETADKFKELMKEIAVGEIEDYSVGEMKLENLPEDVQAKVKGTLRAYNEVHVTYSNGEFHACAAVGIYGHYPTDFFVCGDYKQEEVYTKEERRQNFFEEFGYYPVYLK